MSLSKSVLSMINAGHGCIRIATSEEEEARHAVFDAAIDSGRLLNIWTCVHGVFDGLTDGSKGAPDTENPAAGMFYLWRLVNDREKAVCLLLDVGTHLRKDERVLRAWRDLLQGLQRRGSTLIMIDHDDEVPDIVRQYSTLLEPSLPTEVELEQLLRQTVRDIARSTPITADLPKDHLAALVNNLRGLNKRQARQVIRDAVLPDRALTLTDLPTILAAKRKAIEAAGVLEFVESPASMDQIGGLDNLKNWLKRREVGLREDAAKLGIPPPRGMLLLGVQGSGKSLCAKAVATAWNRPLVRLDAGALYDRYVGESEKRLRTALKQAEFMAPCVLWIDEIEKAFAGASSTSTDGGLSRRMFGALLTWMQERTAPVFLAATANDIQALPPELLRKGRFDEIFFVDLPGLQSRAMIFNIHLRKRGQRPEQFDRAKLAQVSDGFSGAEIEQAILGTIADCAAENQPVTTERLITTLQNSPPLSVTMRENMAELREWAQGRCVPAE